MHAFTDLSNCSHRKLPLFGRTESLTPLPLLGGDLVSKWHQDRHLETVGEIFPCSIYEFDSSFAGPRGLLISESGHFIYSPDLIHDYMRGVMTQMLGTEGDNIYKKAKAGKLDVISLDRPVIFISCPGLEVYGHVLLDIMPGLWALVSSTSMHGIALRDYDVLVGSSVPAWAVKMLEFAFGSYGLNIVTYDESTTVVRAPSIVRVSYLRNDRVFSPILNMFSNFLAEKADSISTLDPSGYKKLYISRIGVQSFVDREVENEMAILDVAKEFGYICFDPTKYSWVDQISIFSHAEFMCGPFGSGMHNSLLSPSATRSVMFGYPRKMAWLQSGLSALRQQRMSYIFPSSQELIGTKDILTYDTGLFRRILAAVE